tara:strand:+ start:874 stop:1473 length:600 start_codon:yes stop_codon:yes gene_type:complete
VKQNYIYFIALIFFVFSCDDSEASPSSLEENQEKWQSHNLKSYRMNLNVACFCVPTPDIDIRVDNGKISLISANGSSYANPDIDSTFWHAKTVDGLFSFIDEKLSENPFQKTLKFNSKYGYPKEIFFDIDEMIVDEEIGYFVHSFSPINEGCIDTSKISNNPCIEVYDPVCGCDGATYSNSCKASVSGVTSYVPGVCSK